MSGGKLRKSVTTRKPKGKGKGSESAQGKPSTLADALADALSKIEAQSIPLATRMHNLKQAVQ